MHALGHVARKRSETCPLIRSGESNKWFPAEVFIQQILAEAQLVPGSVLGSVWAGRMRGEATESNSKCNTGSCPRVDVTRRRQTQWNMDVAFRAWAVWDEP